MSDYGCGDKRCSKCHPAEAAARQAREEADARDKWYRETFLPAVLRAKLEGLL